MRIGFIGLGSMGLPMARRLAIHGQTVQGYDVHPQAAQAATANGISHCASAHDAVRGADFVISMLPSGDQVAALLDSPGFLGSLKPGCTVIDSSTIDIANCKRIHSNLKEKGMDFLDAPVSGGIAGAAAGTLTFMVGGDLQVFEKAKPVLEMMGKKLVYAGEGSSGQAAKVCNNLMTAISMVGVSEGLNLAMRLGLDPVKFFEISSSSSGQSWALTSYAPIAGLVPTAPANRRYEGGFASELMLKDLRLAEGAARQSGAYIPLGEAASALYASHCEQGAGRLDFSSIVKFLDSGAARDAQRTHVKDQ